MASHVDAERYLSDLGDPAKRLAQMVHETLVAEGCDSYVKTIYIGYDIGGEMVAALYGHSDHVEIALALPEEAEGSLLADASHLTWRTLPVAAIVRSPEDHDDFAQLASEACDRIRSASHAVMRDNDFFMRSRRERRGRGGQAR